MYGDDVIRHVASDHLVIVSVRIGYYWDRKPFQSDLSKRENLLVAQN